jgi:hypothetical protein
MRDICDFTIELNLPVPTVARHIVVRSAQGDYSKRSVSGTKERES